MRAAINVCLVLLGIRPAARLESSNGPKTMRALVALGRQHGFVVIPVNEPLIINPKMVRASDIAIVQRLYANTFDMDEPLLGALGRLLGYRCVAPGARREHVIDFWVHVQCQFGRPQKVQLAGISCGHGESAKAIDTLTKQWVIPALAALGGFEAIIGGKTCRIVGFWIEVGAPL